MEAAEGVVALSHKDYTRYRLAATAHREASHNRLKAQVAFAGKHRRQMRHKAVFPKEKQSRKLLSRRSGKKLLLVEVKFHMNYIAYAVLLTAI